MNPEMKKELLAYQAENVRLYGCWSCKQTRTTLYKRGEMLYACPAHRFTRLPRA
jgi:hypothetical protein